MLASSKDISITCPRCMRANAVSITGDGRLPMKCEHCKWDFVTLFATVRAKRSRYLGDARFYSVRVKYGGDTEELLEYAQPGSYDFELRGGDLAAFSFRRDILAVSQNLTLGRHQVNIKPFTWNIVIGFVFVVIIAAEVYWYWFR